MNSTFFEVFGGAPTLSARAPGRVNLLGEHTDYNDGFVLPTAIPQRTTVSLRANDTRRFVVHSENLGIAASFDLEQAPAEHFASYVFGCLRLVADGGAHVPGLDIHLTSDVPIGVGLSSSAALEVAMLRALRELLALPLDDVQIARLAQRAEIEYAGVHCGIMDQMACSLADTSTMLFLDTRTLDRRLLPLPPETELLVIDSGVPRSLADTAYNERRAQCADAAARLGVPALRDIAGVRELDRLPDSLRRFARHVVTENARVLRAVAAIDADRFGELMNDSHASLRDDYQVSIDALDVLVTLLQRHPSVHGARLTGAGFGGACVALCRQGQARQAGLDVMARYREAGHDGRVLVPQDG